MNKQQDLETNYIQKVCSIVLSKINVRSVSMLIALVISVCGCLMIFQDIKDEGEIDITSPFITGKIKSGFVGILLIFLGAVITITALLRKMAIKGTQQSIKLCKGDTAIEWEGNIYHRDNALDVLALFSEMSNEHVGDKKELIDKAKNKTKECVVTPNECERSV